MFFLGKTSVGLDIDDSSLELVALQQTVRGVKISSSSRIILPVGLIEDGKIKDEVKLSEAISRLFTSAKPAKIKASNVVFGLPHSQFYPALVELPLSGSKQLVEAIWQAAYTNLPFEQGDLLLEYKILEQTDKSNLVLLIGTSKKYVLSWQKLLADLGVTIDIFDISSYALWRDLKVDSTSAVALVDLGASKSNVFIFNKEQLNYSYDFESGGNNLTKRIEEKFNLTFDLDEDKKNKLGLNRQLFPVLEKTLHHQTKEIAAAIEDYEAKTEQKVTAINLVGGGALLKGLTNYYQEQFSLPVSVGKLKSLKASLDPLYVEAYGLALRGLAVDKFKLQPAISLTSSRIVPDLIAKDSDQQEAILSVSKNVKESEEVDQASEDDDLADVDSEKNKYQMEKKLLAAILLVGALALGGAYWYRSQTKAKLLKQQSSQVIEFAEVQTFPYKIKVTLGTVGDSQGLAKGRLVNDTIASGTDFVEVLNNSRRKVTAELTADEELWPEPLNEIIDKANVAYPLTFRWLVLNRKEILNLALAEIEQVNTDRIPYEFNAITKTKIEKIDSLDEVYLYGEISVSLNKKIANTQIVDLSSLATTSPTSTLTATSTDLISSSTIVETGSTSTPVIETSSSTLNSQQVVIGETETGWLNVRQGPGKTYSIVIKIYPGDKFESTNKDGDWLQINLKDGGQGWILAKYVKVSE